MFDSFRKCSKCNSRKLQRSFGINGRGESYKTCVACRTKDRVNNTNIKNNIYINEYNFNNNNNDNLNYKQELII